MKKKSNIMLALFFLLSNVALLSLCAKTESKQKTSGGLFQNFKMPFSFKSPFSKTTTETISYQKEVPANVEFTIDNKYGDTTIKAWKNNSVLIEATKTGTQKAVKSTQIEIHKGTNTLSIKTMAEGNDEPCKIHYTVLVPEGAKLESVTTEKGEITIHNLQNKIVAHTRNGGIKMNNVAGIIETSTKKGSISINTNTIIPDTTIFAFADQGKINLSVPKKTNAAFVAETKQGKFESTVAITTSPHTMKFNNKTLAQLKRKADGTIGKGGSASIKLHTNKGNIILNEA